MSLSLRVDDIILPDFFLFCGVFISFIWRQNRVRVPYYSSPSAVLHESRCRPTPVVLPSGLESGNGMIRQELRIFVVNLLKSVG